MLQTTKESKPRPPGSSRHMGKRKLRPTGIPMDQAELTSMYADLEQMIRDTRALELAIDAQLTPSDVSKGGP